MRRPCVAQPGVHCRSPFETMTSTILVTGAAGFIGMHVSALLAGEGHRVVGVDNLNDYYDPALKRARLAELSVHRSFSFERADVADAAAIQDIFARERPQYVVHLAAQAGVRYALDHPLTYVSSNLQGSTVILEACRHHEVRHLVFASSSSVYGGNVNVPFRETDRVDHPVSFYAATKRGNELMAHSYAHLFALPVTMLRYFTVYGPWGRPDMAIWKFTNGLLSNTPIDVYAGGDLSRDFTHVADSAQATRELLFRPPKSSGAGPASIADARPDHSWAPFEIYNVGRSDPVSVNHLISLLETHTGARAIRRELPMQPGDVERTFADPSKLRAATGFEPRVALDEGLEEFVRWFRDWRARSGGLAG
jgi:UDP-glucuronate 4-epimerase